MPLISLNCPNCGGSLQVNNEKKTCVCTHCDSPFLVEEAINNTVNYNQIQANVVNFWGGNTADFEIRAGELLKYNGASANVVIPNTVTHIGEAFKGCKGLVSVVIPDSVKEIGNGAFAGCTCLTSITVPESVKAIGDENCYYNGAFSNCTSLTSITIPQGIKIIGADAFSGCSSLESIKIAKSVTTIGKRAFQGCSSLRSLRIPQEVTTIGENAFSGCTSLISIDIPKKVTMIGSAAFSGCTSLTSVSIPDDMVLYDQFFNCPKLVNIHYNKLLENLRAFPDYSQLRDTRISQRKCTYCGGRFRFFRRHICCSCNRKKDY